MYEKQLEQIEGARMTLETQKLALEQLNINKEVLDAQRAGAATMASVTALMGGVDAVDDTMGQIEDGLVRANVATERQRPVKSRVATSHTTSRPATSRVATSHTTSRATTSGSHGGRVPPRGSMRGSI